MLQTLPETVLPWCVTNKLLKLKPLNRLHVIGLFEVQDAVTQQIQMSQTLSLF